MTDSLPTISVGIPAHNEAENIKVILKSILRQQGNFKLKKILVVCDGCTDQTARIVSSFARKHYQVELLDDGKRLGKASRLNQIYAWNKSDYLATFDADVALERECELDLMLQALQSNPHAVVSCGRLVPVLQQSWMGKFSVVSYLSFEDAFLRHRNGNNFYSLVGCASLIEKHFAHRVHYPRSLTADMNYLYALAVRHHSEGVQLARDTRILFRTVSTFHDWRVLATRSVGGDKLNLAEFLGDDILRDYRIPRWIGITSQLRWLIRSPLAMTGSIVLNIFIRLVPLKSARPKVGVWEDTRSSKHAIMVSTV